jgi:hypothetical protein
MIERILEAPLRSSQNSNNKELENKLLLIKDHVKEQVKQNDLYRAEMLEEDKVGVAVEYEYDSRSSYESYYEEEVEEGEKGEKEENHEK